MVRLPIRNNIGCILIIENIINYRHSSVNKKFCFKYVLNYILYMIINLFCYKVLPESKPRSSKWVSSSIPESEWGNELAQTSSPEYHTNNLLGQVLFEEASQHIPENAIAIEIAPHGLLQAILKRSLSENVTNIPLTQKTTKDSVTFLLNAIGK